MYLINLNIYINYCLTIREKTEEFDTRARVDHFFEFKPSNHSKHTCSCLWAQGIFLIKINDFRGLLTGTLKHHVMTTHWADYQRRTKSVYGV